MNKRHYLKELTILTEQKRGGSNIKKEVLKIQSWLCLQEMQTRGIGSFTSIDGDFGPATQQAVKNFQRFKSISETGIVDQALFSLLSKPLKLSFEGPILSTTVRTAIVEVAEMHLLQSPTELYISGQTNMGPWVRSYMDKYEGDIWLWCMGFVQAIIDQAFSHFGKNFKSMMDHTYSCDVVAQNGKRKSVLINNATIKANPSLVQPGDIFLLRKSANDWIHTGIVIGVGSDTILTIEGNTNTDGSRNGVGVFKRVRNFRTSPIDIFSIENWTQV